MRGKYIVIEGTDGSGKSTVQENLSQWLKAQGKVVWDAHEPGSTPMAEAIRTIVKDGTLKRTPMTELLLFTAARLELIDEIRRRLAQGEWVMSSRNYLSSIVYQGKARGLGVDKVMNICHKFLPKDYLMPNMMIVIDVAIDTASTRREQRDRQAMQADAFESEGTEFQTALINGYREIAQKLAVPLIDGNGSANEVCQKVISLVSEQLCHKNA